MDSIEHRFMTSTCSGNKLFGVQLKCLIALCKNCDIIRRLGQRLHPLSDNSINMDSVNTWTVSTRWPIIAVRWEQRWHTHLKRWGGLKEAVKVAQPFWPFLVLFFVRNPTHDRYFLCRSQIIPSGTRTNFHYHTGSLVTLGWTKFILWKYTFSLDTKEDQDEGGDVLRTHSVSTEPLNVTWWRSAFFTRQLTEEHF